MKTQIIQLDYHDDIVSARDKMTWGKTPRLLLVWPERERILTRRLDLVLLQRHSQSLGSQLALVTRDSEVKGFARELGILCFKDIDRAQQVRWRRSRRKLRIVRPAKDPDSTVDLRELRQTLLPTHGPNWLQTLPVRIAAFVIGLTAVFILMGALFPTASIDLHPVLQNQEMTLPILASPKFEVSNLLSGQIPVRWTTVVVEGQDTLAASGQVNVPQNPATGQVTFSNLTNHSVEIPLGTVVQGTGQGIRYKTTRSAVVPAGLSQKVDVPIQSINPGRAANVPANTIQAIEGPLGLSLSVNNAQSTVGGKDQSSLSPNSSDLASLRERLLKSLNKAALVDLNNSLGTGKMILASSIQTTRIVSEKLDPPLNTPSDHLTLSLQVEYKAGYLSQNELMNMANSALDTALKKGYRAVSDSLLIQPKSDPTVDKDGVYHWQMRIQRKISPLISTEQVVRLIAGQNIAQAQNRLTSLFPLQSPATIRLTPSWWPWLPYLPFRIQVTNG